MSKKSLYCECGNTKPKDGKDGCLRCRDIDRKRDSSDNSLGGSHEPEQRSFIKNGPNHLLLSQVQSWKHIRYNRWKEANEPELELPREYYDA